MKCPNCQKELKDEAKFCTQCGTKIVYEQQVEVETINKNEPLEIPEEEGTVIIKDSLEMSEEEGTMMIKESLETLEEEGTVLLNESFEIPKQDSIGNAIGNVPKPLPAQMVREQNGKKEKKGTIFIIIGIIAVVVLLLCVVLGIFVLGNKKDTNKQKVEEVEQEVNVKVNESKDIQESEAEEMTQKEIILSLEIADQMLMEAEKKVKRDEELLDGIELLRQAIDEYVKEATAAGDCLLVSEQVKKGCLLYEQAILRRKELLQGFELSGGVYAQIMMEMDSAIEYCTNLQNMGYPIDLTNLNMEKELFDVAYRETIIHTFDQFTLRENWSRTESWNLMSQTDSMYATDDLDDPIRLRYAYALAWWMQKQIETELVNGTITQKGAATKIADVIEATDYNLMLINDYISFRKAAGEECQEVEVAYQEVIAHIAETQNLQIGQDLPITRLWQFNDFGQYSCDEVNGITSDNMNWIRERFKDVSFND